LPPAPAVLPSTSHPLSNAATTRSLRPEEITTMRKSVVTTLVTAVFVLYSFYQRAVGVPATADAGPIPAITSPASSSSQGPSVGSTPTPVPKATQTPTGQPGSPYRDGTYAGAPADAFYGNIQVQATITNGKLTSVQFLEWPNDRSRSVRINQQALPSLVQEAIKAQNSNVNVVSGATDSSVAFARSLQSALGEAKG